MSQLLSEKTEDQTVDPYSINGTITRCIGALEGVNKSLDYLTKKVEPFTFQDEPNDSLSKVQDIPANRSRTAISVETIYTEISAIESRIDHLASRISN